MVRILFFNLLFLACVGYALTRGAWPERSVALIFVGARIGTNAMLLLSGSYYHRPEFGVFAVDALTFFALLWIALTADRFWPMLVAAMQGVSLLAHLGELIAYDIIQNTYLNAVQLWAYPQLVILALGTMRFFLRARGRDAGWWPQTRIDAL